LNAVEREPVETRVLNPNGSETSYKPEQRSYRKMKLNFFLLFFIFFFGGILVGGILSWNHAEHLMSVIRGHFAFDASSSI